MTHEDAFVQRILDQTDDDAPRLVYADWLDEQGQGPRAEFIRLQVLTARRPDADPQTEDRLRELLAAHREQWLGPLGAVAPADCYVFHRGFPEELQLRNRSLGDRGASALAASHHLGPLTTLGLRGNGIANEGVPALAASPDLAHLTTLDLGENDIDPEGVVPLEASPHFARLRCLNLGSNWIGAVGASALATSSHLANLTNLDLGNHAYMRSGGISDEGASALAASPHLANLIALDLYGNEIGPEGARALAASPHLARLRSLNLGQNWIGAAGARALAASPHLANLNTLELEYNKLGADGVRALAASPHLANLTTLDLNYNWIDEVGGAGGVGDLPLPCSTHQTEPVRNRRHRGGRAGGAAGPVRQRRLVVAVAGDQRKVGASHPQGVRASSFRGRPANCPNQTQAPLRRLVGHGIDAETQGHRPAHSLPC